MARGDVIVRLRLLGAQAMSKGARDASRAITGIGSAASKAEARGLMRLRAGAESVSGGLASMVNVSARAVAGLTAVSGVAAAFAARDGLSYLRTIDRQRVAFETFTRSAEKAEWIMGEVRRMAKESPALDIGTAGAGVQSLMSYGINARQAIMFTEKLSDAAAASGRSVDEAMGLGALAIGQIQGKGKLVTQELNQLSEGVRLNRAAIARELGMTMPEFTKALESGAISAEKAIPAIGRALDKQFAGAQAKMARTTEGRLAGMRDVIGEKAGEFLRPFYDAVGVLAKMIGDRLGKIDTKAIGERVFGALRAGAQAIAGIDFAPIVGFFRGLVEAAGRVDWGAVLGQAKQAGQAAADAIRQVVDAIRPAVPFLKNVLWPLIKGIAKSVGATLVLAFRIAVPIIRTVSRVLGWIGEKARPLSGWIERLGMLIGLLFPGTFLRALGTVFRVFAAAGGVFGTAFRALSFGLKVVTAPLRFVLGLVSRAGKAFRWVGMKAREGGGLISKAWSAVTGKLKDWLGSIAAKFEWVWAKISPVVDRIVGAAKRIGNVVGALNPFDDSGPSTPITPTMPWMRDQAAAAGPRPSTLVPANPLAPTGGKGTKGSKERIAPRRGDGDRFVAVTTNLNGEPIHREVVRVERKRTEHR